MWKAMLPLAIGYGLTGSLLYLASCHIWGETAYALALPIVALAVFFFSYTLGSLWFFHRLLSTQPGALTAYYLGSKMLRLVLTALVLVVYGLAGGGCLVGFALTAFLFYLIAAVTASIYCVKQEKRMSA